MGGKGKTIHDFIKAVNSNCHLSLLSSTVSQMILPVLYAQSQLFHTPLLLWLKFGSVPFGVDRRCWGLRRAGILG